MPTLPHPPVHNRKGTLYVVSLPIGNPADITDRARDILCTAELILCEDTRIARPFLKSIGSEKEAVKLRSRNDIDVIRTAVVALESGTDVALVSDAGTPLVSDPGLALVCRALDGGLAVKAAPGASAVLCALAVSGFSAQRFVFDGFPPRSRSDRRTFFQSLRSERRTIVLFETKSHLRSTIRELATQLGADRMASVLRNLTLSDEARYAASLGDLIIELNPPPAGEYVIVIESAPA